MTPNRAAVALLCGALALLPGCGSGTKRTIPTDRGDRLIRAINAADQYSASGECSRARKKVGDARFLLDRLPSTVDKDTRQGISDGLTRLDSLISSECASKQKPKTDTTNTETTQSQTTESQTTPTTQTTTSQTTTSQTQTTQTSTLPTTTSTTPTGTSTGTGTTTTGNGGTPPPSGNGQGNG